MSKVYNRNYGSLYRLGGGGLTRMVAQTNFPSIFPLFSARLAGPNTA